MSDVAHLGPVEIFTPRFDESLAFFVDILGMDVEAQAGSSCFLRGWGDYQRWSVKLTASDTSGIGVLGLRAWSPEALQRRVTAVEATGLGEGWTDGDLGRGPSYRFRDPDDHRFDLYYECERYVAPEHLYGIEPGGNRVELTTGGRFVYDPDEPLTSGPRPNAPRARRGARTQASDRVLRGLGRPPLGSDDRRAQVTEWSSRG